MPRKWYLLHRKRDGHPPAREMVRVRKAFMHYYVGLVPEGRYVAYYGQTLRNPRMKPLLHNGGKA